ncbi:MAG: hypothetical protein VW397_05285, partial [Candidatus Margulisiibacteriota bacterium]
MKLILFLFITLLPSTLHATLDYTIEEFLDDVTHKLVKKQELNNTIEISKLNYTSAVSITDWQFSTALFTSHNEPFQASSFSSDFINARGLNFSIDRPIQLTGGQFGISLKQHRIEQQNISFGGTSLNEPLYYQNTIGISYNQPLLYGVFGEIYNLPIQTASANT